MAPACRSWIVLGQDGRHVTLCLAAPPTDAEIAATLDGAYRACGSVTLLAVRMIGVAVDRGWLAAFTGSPDARRSARL
jgi:hypothetical protein